MMLPGARLAARGQAAATGSQLVPGGVAAVFRPLHAPAPVAAGLPRCITSQVSSRKVLAKPAHSALQALDTTSVELAGSHTVSQLPGAVVVTFHVAGAHENAAGFRVVGNIPVLGNWLPDEGVVLEHVAPGMWSASCTLPDDWEGCIEYKVVETPETTPAVWEPGPNRKLQIAGVADPTCVTVLDVSCNWAKEGVAVKLSRPAPTIVEPPRNGNGHASRESSPSPRGRHPEPGHPVACRLLMTLPDVPAPGVQYVLVGSAPQMGAWELDKGVKLVGSGPHIVEADTKLPCGTDVEFKVVILYPNSAPVWEKGPNRTLHVPLPPDDHGPGRMALLLHLTQPAMVHHVYEQACQGELGELPPELPTDCLISVPSFHVRPGQELLLAGNLPELGEWMVEGALHLRSVGPDCWQGEVQLPLGAQAEAKLVVRDPNGACFWETGANRVFKVSGECTAISAHATSATSCVALLPNPAVAPAVVFPVFGGPDSAEELPPTRPRSRTRSPSPSVNPEQGVFNVFQASVTGQSTPGYDDGGFDGYGELPNAYGQQGGSLLANTHASSSSSRRSASPNLPQSAGGRFGPSMSDRSASGSGAGTSASSSSRPKAGSKAPSPSRQASPRPTSAPLQQMLELEGRMNKLKTGLGAVEQDLAGAGVDTDSEPDVPTLQSLAKGRSKSPEPTRRRTPTPQPKAAPEPKPSKAEQTAAAAMEGAAGKNGRSKRTPTPQPGKSAPGLDSEPDFFAYAKVPSTYVGLPEEPSTAPFAPESKAPTPRPSRGRATRGSPVKSPAPLSSGAPDGMDVYEARVLGILAACPNQSLDQVQTMLLASNFPPRYNKSAEQLRGLMTYLVAHGTVATDGDGKYKLRDIEVVPASRRRSVSPRAKAARGSPGSPDTEPSSPAAPKPRARASPASAVVGNDGPAPTPAPARARRTRKSTSGSADEESVGGTPAPRRKRATKKDTVEAQAVTSRAKSASADAGSHVLPAPDMVPKRTRRTRATSAGASPAL